MIIRCLLPDAVEWLGPSDLTRRNTGSRWRLENWSSYRLYARLPPIGLSSATGSVAASRSGSAQAERRYTSRKFFKWLCRGEFRRLEHCFKSLLFSGQYNCSPPCCLGSSAPPPPGDGVLLLSTAMSSPVPASITLVWPYDSIFESGNTITA